MTEAGFDIDVAEDDALRFAELSGDWNPLHTDPTYARTTTHGRIVLHGAFSAGLVSRLAGMYLPGRECLLHSLRLRFLRPILPPVRLRVSGHVTRSDSGSGAVDVTISDQQTGIRYVEGAYAFGYHHPGGATVEVPSVDQPHEDELAPVLVTGATGGLGSALIQRLGTRALGVSRSGGPGLLQADSVRDVSALLGERRIAGIVHCGWPAPDNVPLVDLQGNARAAIDHSVSRPLEDIVELAQLLVSHGEPGASLVVIGSSFADPGRHGWRMPLYSLSKSLVPTLVSILSVELGGRGFRCVGVSFDVLDGGLNASMSPMARVTNADRVPSGELPGMDSAADQIAWVLSNTSSMVSGAMVTLSGGALP